VQNISRKTQKALGNRSRRKTQLVFLQFPILILLRLNYKFTQITGKETGNWTYVLFEGVPMLEADAADADPPLP
jgi:hypothetical protein